MRNIWLQNAITGAIWDLLPDNPYTKVDGSPFLSISGLGYNQEITQNQVGVSYFISKISSQNSPIKGTMLFWDDEHIRNFQEYIGDFRNPFLLYYSPSGEFEPYDRISKIFYKRVTVSIVDKGEKNAYGCYECDVTFVPQDDVWKRDITYSVTDIGMAGNALTYPYTYPYVYGGRNALVLEIENRGREVGCKITIKNNSEVVLGNIEWFSEHTYVDQYGVLQTEVQRAKWYTESTSVTLQSGYSLIVDSNALSQEAIVKFTDGTSQSVVNQQEPSWDYINFVQLKNGSNRFVFYVDNDNIDITVEYTEQKEII